MPPAPRLNADFYWQCPACHRPFRRPDQAAQCPCPSKQTPAAAIVAPLVRCLDLAMFDGHAVALTALLEAEQAELTVLHRRRNGTFKATRHRFCAPRKSLQPTGASALVPAA
jgi:hypothetical protein